MEPDDIEFLDVVYWGSRLLQEDNVTNSTTNSTGNSTETAPAVSDSAVLRNTFTVYGTALIIVFLTFCFIRLKYPRPFTLRRWIDKIKTPLADDQHGFFSWVWILRLTIADDEFLEHCGLDALCFIRVLTFGYKLALVGVFNAIWLMPMYYTSPDSEETSAITEGAVMITISNVPPESPRLIGTVLAAYIFFGYTMYAILKEFQWFIEMRHKFLSKAMARNYTLYIRNIPAEYATNAGLERFFRNCFSPDAVAEAHLRVICPELGRAVAARDAMVTKLEHEIALDELKTSNRRSKRGLLMSSSTSNTAEYAEELNDMNEDVTLRIESIETMISPPPSSTPRAKKPQTSEAGSLAVVPVSSPRADDMSSLATEEVSENNGSDEGLLSDVEQGVRAGLMNSQKFLSRGVSSVKLLVTGGDDGKQCDAGFVSFTKLATKNAALQMVHHSTPFAIEALDSPEPEDIVWPNVGKSHKEIQVGRLVSLALSVVLCVLWTIPMSFFASLSSVEALRARFDFIDDLLIAAPFLVPVFELLAPLLVVVAGSMLPTLLTIITNFEGLIAGTFLEASLFVKLSAFMIIQTFFVSAISGSLLKELASIAENPTQLVSLLAVSLPSQSTYFIQIVFVSTLISSSMEILRVVPLALAAIRSVFGPRLTEKERQQSYFFLRPLADPQDFEHADVFSNCILYFMVLFVYTVIAPLTCFVSGFCFLYLGALFRHSFIYIYPVTDSGGRLWTSFINILLMCMIIAELVVFGLLGLKKAKVAAPLMIPLLIITLLFDRYIRQQHFRVAEYLPSRDCVKADTGNSSANSTVDLKTIIAGAYVQPELQEKVALPETTTELQIDLGLLAPIAEDENHELSTNADDPDVALPSSSTLAKNDEGNIVDPASASHRSTCVQM